MSNGIGVSPWGMGLTNLSEALSKYLGLKMASNDREKERAMHEREFQAQLGLSREEFEQMKREHQLTQDARVRGEVRQDVMDLPPGDIPTELYDAMAKRAGGPENLPGVLRRLMTLPSKQTAEGVTTESPSQDYARRLPTFSEGQQMAQTEMERKRLEAETANDPLKRQLLNNQIATSTPEFTRGTLALQHKYALDEMRQRAQLGDKDFMGDIRAWAQVQAMLAKMDPGDPDYASTKTAADVFFGHITNKYPEMKDQIEKMRPVGQHMPGDIDLNTGKRFTMPGNPGTGTSGLPTPPNPPSAISRFLTGAGQVGDPEIAASDATRGTGTDVMRLLEALGMSSMNNKCPDGSVAINGKCPQR